jgi:segregation and condensation protein A
MQTQAMASVINAAEFDIARFVNEATWKDILLDLVRKDKLNPWDIDITEIVSKYVDVVKGLRVMDLRVPANIILAASIMLRLKSDMLELGESPAFEQDGAIQMERPFVQVEGLSARLRLPPRRRVTLHELISALEEAMQLKEYRTERLLSEGKPVPLMLERTDVEADVEALYSTIKKNADSSGALTFSSLCSISHREDALLDVFMPLLFLANRNRVLLMQERFFREIIISLN